uniref:Plasminogen receptor with a C-terminal lysine n=1 Tax=Lynx canadensis TaxID=61383 RepID=A0A667IAW4_LYNCA
MGFIFSKSMNENMKNQQEFMLMNARLQLERQLMMQNEMRERQMALQIAWSREFLKYFGTFFGIAAISLTAGAIRRKKPAFLFPIIPLGFVLTYQYDLGYGTLLQRMKGQFLIKQSLFLIHLLVQGSSPYGPFIYGHFDKTPLSELPMTNISAPSHSSVLESTHTSSRELSNFQEFVSWLLNTVIKNLII